MPRAIAPEVTRTTSSPRPLIAATCPQIESSTSARSSPSSAATIEEPSFTTSVMTGKSRSDPPPFRHELRVRYGECDAQGIVFNANYLAYVDVALTELWRAAFGSYDSVVERGVDVVVHEANLLFRASARFDDLLAIEGGFEPLGRASAVLRFAFRREEEDLVEARLRYVFVDARSWQKTPIPDWVRDGLAPYVL
jgi:acyl-CoA thioester hydrolase